MFNFFLTKSYTTLDIVFVLRKNTNLISWNMHQVGKQLVQGWQHFLPLCQSAPNMALDFYLQTNITKT